MCHDYAEEGLSRGIGRQQELIDRVKEWIDEGLLAWSTYPSVCSSAPTTVPIPESMERVFNPKRLASFSVKPTVATCGSVKTT